MDPTTRRQALARVSRTAAELDHAKAARNAAIVDAMALGIPRAEIAKAAKVHVRRLAQIRHGE